MLATAVGIDGMLEINVGRIVAADDAARVFKRDLRLQWRRRIAAVWLTRAPAVVKGVAHVPLKTVRNAAGGATPFDGRRRNEYAGHSYSIKALVSS